MGLLILFGTAVAVIAAFCTLALIHHMQAPRRHTFAVAIARQEPTDPRDMGFEAEDRVFQFDDGTTSPGWIVRGQSQQGPTVIITHGMADSRYGSLLRLPLVTPWASRVVLYDMRGHGESTAKRTTLTAREPDDLLRVMNEIDNGSPMILMGHSMGAGVSMVAAVRDIEAATAQQPRVIGVVAEGGYRWPMETIHNYLRHHGWPPFPAVMLASWHFSFWLGITKQNFDRVRYAARLKCPLLVINGEEDAVSPLESARQVAAAAKHGTFITIPRGGHSDLATTHRKVFHDSLSKWVQQFPMELQRLNTHIGSAAIASCQA